jgi:alpha-tubulin suppressor-like RCC1 family protein
MYYNFHQIEFFKNIFIIDCSVGSYHCLAISKNGDIFSWGRNTDGQLGFKEPKSSPKPTKIYSIDLLK